jgi:hypothetical protein
VAGELISRYALDGLPTRPSTVPPHPQSARASSSSSRHAPTSAVSQKPQPDSHRCAQHSSHSRSSSSNGGSHGKQNCARAESQRRAQAMANEAARGGTSCLSAAAVEAAAAEARRRHTDRWAQFEEWSSAAAGAAPVSYDAVPWPPPGPLLCAGSRDEQKRELRELLRRWHPDKWCVASVGLVVVALGSVGVGFVTERGGEAVHWEGMRHCASCGDKSAYPPCGCTRVWNLSAHHPNR